VSGEEHMIIFTGWPGGRASDSKQTKAFEETQSSKSNITGFVQIRQPQDVPSQHIVAEELTLLIHLMTQPPLMIVLMKH